MQNRIDDDVLATDPIKDPEWKSTKQCPTNLLMNDRILKRMVR
jgi:hypothetical protein